jgi:hypothetical protein
MVGSALFSRLRTYFSLEQIAAGYLATAAISLLMVVMTSVQFRFRFYSSWSYGACIAESACACGVLPRV